MLDTERKIWEIRVPKDVELSPLKNKMSKNKTKTLKKELRELENKKKWWKREMNKMTMKNDLSKNDPWLKLPWNTVWAYLSFLSEPRTQAYITYLKVHFNQTWILGLKRVFLEKFFVINKAVVSFPKPTKESWSIFHLFGMNFELSSA